MRDPWGRPFAGHLASEEVEPVTVDGRPASRITLDVRLLPVALEPGERQSGPSRAPPTRTTYVTHPSSMHISVPLPIPDGTPDGTTYPNTATATTNHFAGGAIVRTQGATDDALITVTNPAPPPPATKTAVPDARRAGRRPSTGSSRPTWTRARCGSTSAGPTPSPPSMEFVGYGTPTCVVTGTSTPCSAPTVIPTTLTPVANADGTHDRRVVRRRPPRLRRYGADAAAPGDRQASSVRRSRVTSSPTPPPASRTTTTRSRTVTTPPDAATFSFTTPTAGTATVVEPHLDDHQDRHQRPRPLPGRRHRELRGDRH